MEEVRSGNIAGVKFMLKYCNEIDINNVNTKHVTPLILASKKGHSDLVQLLLDQKGIDINKADSMGPNFKLILKTVHW